MADAPYIQIAGLNQFARAAKKVEEDLDGELKSLHMEMAERMVVPARQYAPKRSGNLADSIRAQATARVARIVAGKAKVPYAPPIHWGWKARGITANPFLLNALDAQGSRVSQDYLSRLEAITSREFNYTPKVDN